MHSAVAVAHEPLPVLSRLRSAIEGALEGKPDVVELALVALLGRGHALIEDVPGVGKTTLARALAKAVGCELRRVQFTSDLLPSDILGVSVYDQRVGDFHVRQGPIFSNVLLADEINRASPRTQSALLEAMNEGQVSLDGTTTPLPDPFFVIATQNPDDFAGTFPLPESQLDRFMIRIKIGYPPPQVEMHLLLDDDFDRARDVPSVLDPAGLVSLQRQVSRVSFDSALSAYLQAVLNATRTCSALSLGASTRAGMSLARAAKARALLRGRQFCIPDDIHDLAVHVLSHRVRLAAHAEGYMPSREEAEGAVRDVVARVPVPLLGATMSKWRTWLASVKAGLPRLMKWRRRVRPTREGKAYFGITIGVGLAAINTGNNLLYLLLGMLLALVCVSGVMSEISLRHLTVVRRLPARAQVGRPHLVEIEVYNSKGKVPSYAIEVEDLRAGQPADKRCFFLKISPASAQVAAYRRTPQKRGIDRHVGFRVATRFPFGLFEKSREISSEGDLVIYPAVDPIRLGRDEPGRHQGGVLSIGRGGGDEIAGVRPERQGDDPRDIYWRKSTMEGHRVMRERARETHPATTLSLDVRRPAGPSEDWPAKFERAIREVASRAVAHMKRGDRVTIVTSAGQRVRADQSAGIDPLLRFLALVEPVAADAPQTPPRARPLAAE